jgi:hypothetical protein
MGIDFVVYKKNGLMRLVGNLKLGKFFLLEFKKNDKFKYDE